MFEDLEQVMRRGEDTVATRKERWMRNAIVLLISVILFGALYAVIRFVDA